MKTADLIKHTALQLFNTHGVMNVTLRQVAEELNRSYGNITYHYKRKEALLTDLYNDLQHELDELRAAWPAAINPLHQLLEAPAHTFDISLKYRFFYTDYLELNRHYPELMQLVNQRQTDSMHFYRQQLLSLQAAGWFRSDLPALCFDDLMLLSGLLRTHLMQRHAAQHLEEAHASAAKRTYVEQVNRLLLPYLSELGRLSYQAFETAVN